MSRPFVETSFERNEKTNAAFLTALANALETSGALLAHETPVAKTQQSIATLIRDMFMAWPASTELRLRRSFQILVNSVLQRHTDLLDGKSEFNEGVYREWLESMSVFVERANTDDRGQDALLSFELTADRPSYDELRAQADDAVQTLSRTRGDLRAALLTNDIVEVMTLVESELVQIAQRRQAVMQREQRAVPLIVRPIEVEPLFSVEIERSRLEQDVKPLERYARRRLARFVMDVPRDAPMAAVSAAHANIVHSAQRRRASAPTVLVLPRAVNPTHALVHWNSLSTEVLDEIALLDRDDTEFKTRVADIEALYANDTVRALVGGASAYIEGADTSLPAPTLEQALAEWRVPKEESADLREALAVIGVQEMQLRFAAEQNTNALNYNVGAMKKAALTLRVLETSARLVYASAVAGTLRVYTATIFGFETAEWTLLKDRVRDYASTIERQVGAYAYERLLRALAAQVRFVYAHDIDGAADAYRRLATLAFEQSVDSRRVFVSYNTVAAAAVTHVFPTLDAARADFFTVVINAVGSALRAVARLMGRSAALIAMSGALAATITYDAAGVTRGINSAVFADTLHASLDTDSRFAFDTALPLIEHQSVILTADLLSQTA